MQTTCKWCGEESSDRFHEQCAKDLCKVCGRCCKVVLVPTRFEWADMDSRYFYETHGIPVMKDGMNGITLVINDTCPKLVDGQGCSIYDKRPYWCEVYEPKNDPFHASLCPLCVEYEGELPKNNS